MAFVGLILTLIGGWLGWSGWWAILFGLISFVGAHRALPNETGRINAVGFPIYVIGSFLIMKLVSWLHFSVLN